MRDDVWIEGICSTKGLLYGKLLHGPFGGRCFEQLPCACRSGVVLGRSCIYRVEFGEHLSGTPQRLL